MLYKIILYNKMHSALNLYSHKNRQKYKFAVVYEAEFMAGLASITQAPWGGSTV